MKTTPDFLTKVQEISPDFSFVDNPNRPGLTNIFYQGTNYDLPVISSDEIKEEVDHGYRYDFPNGMSARHHSTEEVLARLRQFVTDFDTIKKDYAD